MPEASLESEESPLHTSILNLVAYLDRSNHSSATLLLLERKEANFWNSDLVISTCCLWYKLRVLFRYQGCVLLCIVQMWKKRLSSPWTLCKYPARKSMLPREVCKETKDDTDEADKLISALFCSLYFPSVGKRGREGSTGNWWTWS